MTDSMNLTKIINEVQPEEIYNLEVVVIPTNKPIQRKDLSDKIYSMEQASIIDGGEGAIIIRLKKL
jgi:preprotein translocase subunit SecA